MNVFLAGGVIHFYFRNDQLRFQGKRKHHPFYINTLVRVLIANAVEFGFPEEAWNNHTVSQYGSNKQDDKRENGPLQGFGHGKVTTS